MPNFMVDFSSTEVDDQCPRKYWNMALEGGVGITRKADIVANAIKEASFNDFKAISEMEFLTPLTIQRAIDEILLPVTAEKKKDVRKMELLYRRLGWLAAYASYIEPAIREKYIRLEIDDEIVLDRTPLWVISKPGSVLKQKHGGELVYQEFACMPPSLTNKRWLESWEKNMRLHVGAISASESMKQEIKYAQMIGMYEGYTSVLDDNLAHPYVWGWYNPDKQSWSNTYKDGTGKWEKRPVWEYPGGILQWVKMCGESVANNMFPFTELIEPDRTMVAAWVSRRLNREREINGFHAQCHVNLYLRDVHFPYKTSQCIPSYGGKPCPYVNACWDKDTKVSTCKTGEYVPNLIKSQELKVGEVVS